LCPVEECFYVEIPSSPTQSSLSRYEIPLYREVVEYISSFSISYTIRRLTFYFTVVVTEVKNSLNMIDF